MCSTLVGHPIDLVKVSKYDASRVGANFSDTSSSPASGTYLTVSPSQVRMQTMSVTPGTPPPFTGTFDCLTKTYKHSGVKGLYRGVSAPLTAIAPIYAVVFWGYDMGQRLVRWQYDMGLGQALTINQVMFAGGFSALPTTAIMAPSER